MTAPRAAASRDPASLAAASLAVLLLAPAALGCGGGAPPLLATGELVATMPPGAAALAPGGRVVVVRPDAAGGPALRASIYEGAPAPGWVPAGEVALEPPVAAPAAAGPPVRSARLSADGARLLVAGAFPAPAGAPAPAAGTVSFDLWELAGGKRLGGFTMSGNLVAWEAAQDLSRIVVVTGDRVQDRAVPGGEVRWELEAPIEHEVLLADGTRKRVPGGASIATSMQALVIVPAPTTGPSPVSVLAVGAGEPPGARRYVGEPPCAISADGTFLAARVGDDIQVYDVAVGKMLYTLSRAAANDPLALKFFPGGRELLVERRGTAPAAYDWRTGAELAVLEAGARDLLVSPEGDRILAATDTELRLYRVR